MSESIAYYAKVNFVSKFSYDVIITVNPIQQIPIMCLLTVAIGEKATVHINFTLIVWNTLKLIDKQNIIIKIPKHGSVPGSAMAIRTAFKWLHVMYAYTCHENSFKCPLTV